MATISVNIPDELYDTGMLLAQERDVNLSEIVTVAMVEEVLRDHDKIPDELVEFCINRKYGNRPMVKL